MTEAQTMTALPALSLARRELVRFYRQKARIIGSLGTPIVLWALLGSGLQAAFPAMPGATASISYLKYFFPGNLVLTVLFTSIFTNISVIEDRNEGFLQGVLVAPVSQLGLVLGKVSGGALIALIQGIFFLSLAPLAGFSLSLISLFQVVLAVAVTSLCLTTLGFIFAWRLDSIQGFHSIMNLFLMPMWLLSGAFFPAHRAPWFLKLVIYLNPLTYGFSAIQVALKSENLSSSVLGYSSALGVELLFVAVLLLIAIRV
ncbi:MAG: ABC transporter permease, partial [Deltaproteobacteria bacterium]